MSDEYTSMGFHEGFTDSHFVTGFLVVASKEFTFDSKKIRKAAKKLTRALYKAGVMEAVFVATNKNIACYEKPSDDAEKEALSVVGRLESLAYGERLKCELEKTAFYAEENGDEWYVSENRRLNDEYTKWFRSYENR